MRLGNSSGHCDTADRETPTACARSFTDGPRRARAVALFIVRLKHACIHMASILHCSRVKVACMVTTYGERLNEALLAAGHTRSELAACLRNPKGGLGVSVSAVGQVITGETKQLTAENSALAARFLGINHHWLATGVGSMKDSVPVHRLSVDEPPPQWQVPELQTLKQLQLILQRVEPSMRAILADVLAGWAKDGGSEDRAAAICRLIDTSQKQQASRQRVGT